MLAQSSWIVYRGCLKNRCRYPGWIKIQFLILFHTEIANSTASWVSDNFLQEQCSVTLPLSVNLIAKRMSIYQIEKMRVIYRSKPNWQEPVSVSRHLRKCWYRLLPSHNWKIFPFVSLMKRTITISESKFRLPYNCKNRRTDGERRKYVPVKLESWRFESMNLQSVVHDGFLVVQTLLQN